MWNKWNKVNYLFYFKTKFKFKVKLLIIMP